MQRISTLSTKQPCKTISAAIKLAPSSAAAYLGRGLAYAGLAKYDEAIKDYQWVLKINPNNAEALGNMGVANMLAGRPVEAMSYFERALATRNKPPMASQDRTMDGKTLAGRECCETKSQGADPVICQLHPIRPGTV